MFYMTIQILVHKFLLYLNNFYNFKMFQFMHSLKNVVLINAIIDKTTAMYAIYTFFILEKIPQSPKNNTPKIVNIVLLSKVPGNI